MFFFKKVWVYNLSLNRFKSHDFTGMWAIWMHSSVTQVPPAVRVPLRKRDRPTFAGLTCILHTHPALPGPRFLAEDWRQTTAAVWSRYGGSTECISCGLSLLAPDPHVIILETEGLVVVYGISCWQEQPVITAEHSAHRKRWFIVKRICSKKKKKKKTDRKRRKGGICLPAAYTGM